MIARLADIIADFFVTQKWADQKERDIYQYGCEVIISYAINIMIVLICGFLFHECINISIFYTVFLLMRRFCGGYHADTYLKCNTTFIINLLIVILFIKYSDFVSSIFLITALTASVFIVCAFSPIINNNKPVEKEFISQYRVCSILLVCLFSLITIFMIPYFKKVSIAITLALFSVSVAMLAEKIKAGGESV